MPEMGEATKIINFSACFLPLNVASDCGSCDLLPGNQAIGKLARQVVHCYPTSERSGLEFSTWPGSGRLVAPVGFASMIGGIFPIALCGLSSL